MHKVEYLPVAKRDIEEAVAYIAVTLASPSAARDLLRTISEAVTRISQFPYAFEAYRPKWPLHAELRKAPVGNYVLYYAVYQGRVEIWRLLHGRQNRDAHLQEGSGETHTS